MSNQAEEIIIGLSSMIQCRNCHQVIRTLDLIEDDYLASWSSVRFLPDFALDETLDRGQRVYRCPRNNLILAKRMADKIILISGRAIRFPVDST